jgi:hypothetical protein
MWIFPHTFTIYLLHGLIFWTLGSLIVVQLSAVGVPCWTAMLVNATACCGTIFLVLPIITLAIGMLGKVVMGTLWPLEKELLPGRWGADPQLVRMTRLSWGAGSVLMGKVGRG